jgi:nucleoid-associated protein YgaU
VLGLVALCIQVIESLQAPGATPAASVSDDVLHLRLGAAAPVDPEEDLASGRDYHVVQPGETLSDIAQRLLGDARLATELARINGLSDPNSLTAGQRIRLR